MPKFRVQTPDGTYEVDAPEGTTEEQIKAEIQKTQSADARPEINNIAEGARTVAKGATFGFADEIEAKARTAQSVQDQTSRSDQYKASYEELRQLQADRLAGRTSPEAQARSQELSGMITGENNQLAQEQDARYKSVRDDLRASNAEFARQNPKTAMGLEMLGGIATPAAGVGALRGASTAVKMGAGALQGGAFGALYGAGNANEMEDVGRDALTQGGIGALTGGAFSGIGSLIAPKLQKGAKTLMNKNIKLTPGQAFGGGIDQLEQRVGSVMPGINKARGRAVGQWNKSIIDDVISPLGGKATGLGDDLVSNVKVGQKVLSNAYDDILPNINMKSDPILQKSFKKAVNDEVLGTEARKKLGKEMTKIKGFLKGNKVSGQSIKDIQTHLGQRIQAYSGATNADDMAIRNALENSLDSIMDTVKRQNPNYADQLTKVNKAYAKFIRIETAASKLNGADKFTPKQFQTAVRQTDRSARKRAVAAGDALMQDVGEQGKILGDKIPDSGTAGNLIANTALPLLGAGGAAAGVISPWMLAIPGFSAAMYSKAGMNAFNKWANSGGSRQQLRELVRKYSGAGASGLLTLQD